LILSGAFCTFLISPIPWPGSLLEFVLAFIPP
jgi:hypothetical protein